MKFQMVHENYNVFDLERSLKFYEEALGLTEKRRITAGTALSSSCMSETIPQTSSGFTWLRTGIGPTTLGTMSSTYVQNGQLRRSIRAP